MGTKVITHGKIIIIIIIIIIIKIFIIIKKKETRPETKCLDLQFPTYIYLLCIYKTK